MKLYHGSSVKEFVPTFGLGNDEHDYGRGFYTTDDIELGREWALKVFLEKSGYQPKAGEPLRGFMPNWIGRFYAYAQWYSGVSSAELVSRFPIVDMIALYPGAHDLDLAIAVEKILSGGSHA